MLRYRESSKVDWNKNTAFICELVDKSALQFLKREMVEFSVLSPWKGKVKKQSLE